MWILIESECVSPDIDPDFEKTNKSKFALDFFSFSTNVIGIFSIDLQIGLPNFRGSLQPLKILFIFPPPQHVISSYLSKMEAILAFLDPISITHLNPDLIQIWIPDPKN